MAGVATINVQQIISLTDIHLHMELVCKEMKRTEKSFVDRGYLFKWEGVSTYVGVPGIDNGFNTSLRYSTALRADEVHEASKQ